MTMKVFNVGDALAAADVNEYLVNTKLAIKGGDTSRASNTTLTNDPDLSVAVDANKSYWAEVLIQYVSGTQNFKTAFTVPASATFLGSVTFVPIGGVSPALIVNPLDAGQLITAALHIGGVGVDSSVRFSGVLVTAGSGGNFTFQWAQDTSNVANTIVRAGSSMLLRRVA